jgi:hypothetical protein
MSEREEHFNLGTGWPLAKDEPRPPSFIARAASRLAKAVQGSGRRLAVYMAIGTLIGGLCLWACWWICVSQPVDPATASFLPPKSDAKARRIALEEVKRREGWSGKVLEASPEGYTWYMLVERQTNSRSGTPELRSMAVCGHTGKVWDYQDASPRNHQQDGHE